MALIYGLVSYLNDLRKEWCEKRKNGYTDADGDSLRRYVLEQDRLHVERIRAGGPNEPRRCCNIPDNVPLLHYKPNPSKMNNPKPTHHNYQQPSQRYLQAPQQSFKYKPSQKPHQSYQPSTSSKGGPSQVSKTVPQASQQQKTIKSSLDIKLDEITNKLNNLLEVNQENKELVSSLVVTLELMNTIKEENDTQNLDLDEVETQASLNWFQRKILRKKHKNSERETQFKKANEKCKNKNDITMKHGNTKTNLNQSTQNKNEKKKNHQHCSCSHVTDTVLANMLIQLDEMKQQVLQISQNKSSCVCEIF